MRQERAETKTGEVRRGTCRQAPLVNQQQGAAAAVLHLKLWRLVLGRRQLGVRGQEEEEKRGYGAPVGGGQGQPDPSLPMVELLNPLQISSSPSRTSAVAAARVCRGG
jgi:hypothetical protein